MNEPLTLGRWMKRLRADLDMTQEALAEAVGCAVQTIRTFEIGKRRPSRELADRLADVLRVPLEQRKEFVRLARSPVEHDPARSTATHARGSPGHAAGAPTPDAPRRAAPARRRTTPSSTRRRTA
jgi:transcriptional regulator with XRE-family HTH domain